MAVLLNEMERRALNAVTGYSGLRFAWQTRASPPAWSSMPFRSLLNRFAGRPKPQARLGCGFLVVSTLLTCVLLGINGLIVLNVFHASQAGLPESLRRPQVEQAFVFLGPVLLLLVEWWVCDVTIDWLQPQRR